MDPIMLSSSRRQRPSVPRAIVPGATGTAAGEQAPGRPLVPWYLAALLGGMMAAVVGWLVITAAATAAWFSASSIPLSEVVAFASRFWLLAHGEPMDIAGASVSLMPTGVSVMALLLLRGSAHFAGRQAALSRGEEESRPGWVPVLAVGGLTALGYGIALALTALASGQAVLWWPLGICLAGIGLLGALPGARKGLGARSLLPADVAATLRGAIAGGLVLLALAAAAVVAATLAGADAISSIEDSLQFDTTGVVVWALVLVAYLPSIITWAAAWQLGAGFTFGSGSLVSLSGSQLGMLPAIPILGALPTEGVAPGWYQGWLMVGVLAGIVAAVAGARALARQSSGRVMVVAASAGLLLSAGLLGAAAAAGGDLGSLRMSGLGPRLPELVGLAVPMLVLAATMTGFVWWSVGVLRRRRSGSIG